MGFILVISLPFILFTILLGFGCFLFGRSRGRQELLNSSQVYGVPTPPSPPPHGSDTSYPSPTPPPLITKQDNINKV
ncbi:hypothetical protein MKW92_002604 [Papaver armeniacum]|nr:hypothetical protein MKW92_002604 [Papaver armeniacum]